MQSPSDNSRRNFLKKSALTTAGIAVGSATLSAVEKEKQVDRLMFPKDFLLGVASASYQIEGGWNQDGKGESIWDRWTHIPGRVKINGDVTCDHYNRYKDDIALLKKIGVNTYRFSISWTRIFPNGFGVPNPKGIAFYKDILKLLKENNIKAAVTVFHWDLPQKLQDKGGFANRDIVTHFENYSKYLFQELGESVDYWITFNEPWVTAFMGYYLGSYPPGIKDFSTALLAVHNILLSHGKVAKLHKEMKLKSELGITLDLQYCYPASESHEDRLAAERENIHHHAWFADPIFKGKYPEELWKWYEKKGIVMPEIEAGDMDIIKNPVDFLGLNYYYSEWIHHDPKGWWPYDTTRKKNDNDIFKGRKDNPDGLYDLLVHLNKNYNGVKIIITENGKHLDDFLNGKGEVNDEARIEYIYDHLKACKKAIDAGVNLKGYIIWSFLDDYEWGDFGRMGLVFVNYKTQKRTIKKSGYWFADGVKKGFAV